jgi:Spy/CpxP family protein refolding chaperone
MKKIVFAIVAALMVGATVNAQERQGRRQQMNPEEMMKQRTERVVKQYGLNDEQAAKLLELNKKFEGKLHGGMRGGRGGQMRGGNGGQRPDGARRGEGGRPERPQMTDEQRKEMQANMEAYNKELAEILTPEQLKKYQDDMKNRRPGRRQ